MHGTQKKAPVLAASGRPPPRVIFFAPLEARLDPAPLEMVNFGYTTAKFGHAAQKRDDNSRYFDHPKAAAWICIDELRFYDPRAIIDMLLHDLCEDADLLSPYRLRLNFGLDIALDVQALTKLPDGLETTEQYLGRVVSRGPHPILAKLCDRLHNQRTLGARTSAKRPLRRRGTTTSPYSSLHSRSAANHGMASQKSSSRSSRRRAPHTTSDIARP